MSERYPLSWPEGWKRAKSRGRGKFNKTWESKFSDQVMKKSGPLSVWDGVCRVKRELERIGITDDDIIVSTNVPLRMDGMPRSNVGEPSDPGVAVYWRDGQKKQCIAIDRYDRVADNLAAIAATLEAFRTVARHGGAEIQNRAFQGFAQLPERAGGRGWREILGFDKDERPNTDAIRRHFSSRAQDVHPDKPNGDRNKFEELVWARDAALREIGEKAAVA